MFQSKFYTAYLEKVVSILHLAGYDVNTNDVDTIVQEKFKERIYDAEVLVENNTKTEDEGRYKVAPASKLVDMVTMNKYRPIITGAGTLFHNSTKVKNVPGGFLVFLKAKRKKAKQLMLDLLNVDLNASNQQNFVQLCYKLLANSYYGAFGQNRFHFYNEVLGPSVTAQGRQIIISAIMGFDNLVANNVKLDSFDDLANYLDHILTEEVREDYLVETLEPITVEKVVQALREKCSFKLKDYQADFLEDVVQQVAGRSESQLQKLYFKNNLFKVLNLPMFVDYIKSNFSGEEFPNVNKVPEKLIEPLNVLNEYFEYFVYYPYQVVNKYEKVQTLERKATLVTDTDSAFINARPWLDYICNILDRDVESLTNMERCSFVTPCTYFLTQFIKGVFWELTKNCNVEEEARPFINMKSEYHYKRIVMTKNKKNYAGVQLSKEGVVLDKPKFDVKGLPIKKTTTPRFAREFFGDLLEKDILLSNDIDPKEIFHRFMAFEQSIRDSILRGETRLLQPSVIKGMAQYKNPYRLAQCIATMNWNCIYPDKEITDFSSLRLLKLKPDLERGQLIPVLGEEVVGRLEKFRHEHSISTKAEKEGVEKGSAAYKALIGIGDDKPLLSGSVALPFDLEVIPEELLKIADIPSITNNAIRNGIILLEMVGFNVIPTSKQNVASNILAL